VAFSPDGNTLASASGFVHVRLKGTRRICAHHSTCSGLISPVTRWGDARQSLSDNVLRAFIAQREVSLDDLLEGTETLCGTAMAVAVF